MMSDKKLTITKHLQLLQRYVSVVLFELLNSIDVQKLAHGSKLIILLFQVEHLFP